MKNFIFCVVKIKLQDAITKETIQCDYSKQEVCDSTIENIMARADPENFKNVFFRSILQEVFTKFTGEHLRQSLFLVFL